MTAEMEGRSWRTLAACADSNPDLFFSEAEAKVAEALAICDTCPVTAECLADAIEWGDTIGVRGGVNFSDKTRAKRPNGHKPGGGRPPEPINHGTWSGYKKHLRRKEPMCEPCREASRNRGKDWAA